MNKIKKSVFLTGWIVFIIILILWIYWIKTSNLKSNEFWDAINPIINLVTIYFLWLNWKSLKEEIDEGKRVNKKHEWIYIWAINIEPIRNESYLLEQLWRWWAFDPFGWINIKLKNFWSFPAYLNEIRVIRTDRDWKETIINNAWRLNHNILFPWMEIDGILNIWAPNWPNPEDEWITLKYELKFNNEDNIKILGIYLNYVWYRDDNKNLWYIPFVMKQEMSNP